MNITLERFIHYAVHQFGMVFHKDWCARRSNDETPYAFLSYFSELRVASLGDCNYYYCRATTRF